MERWHPRTGTRRYKTLPTHGVHGRNRYKTLPARRKTPISDHLARAGRKLSRPVSKQPEQGELFPADHHPLATQRTRPGTKLSGHTACKAKPVQNSPGNPHLKATPVQNSPSTAKNAHFSPYDASREKIITARKQTTQAGRTFSRKPPLTSRIGHTHRYKTPLANPRTGAHTNAGGRADSLSVRPPGHQATMLLRASRRRA